MLRPVVLLRWSDEATAAQVDEVVEALRALPARIPELRSYEIGRDEGLREGNFDLAIVAGFDDEAGWRAYASHPEHLEIIERLITPILTGRASVQHTLR